MSDVWGYDFALIYLIPLGGFHPIYPGQHPNMEKLLVVSTTVGYFCVAGQVPIIIIIGHHPLYGSFLVRERPAGARAGRGHAEPTQSAVGPSPGNYVIGGEGDKSKSTVQRT